MEDKRQTDRKKDGQKERWTKKTTGKRIKKIDKQIGRSTDRRWSPHLEMLEATHAADAQNVGKEAAEFLLQHLGM